MVWIALVLRSFFFFFLIPRRLSFSLSFILHSYLSAAILFLCVLGLSIFFIVMRECVLSTVSNYLLCTVSGLSSDDFIASFLFFLLFPWGFIFPSVFFSFLFVPPLIGLCVRPLSFFFFFFLPHRLHVAAVYCSHSRFSLASASFIVLKAWLLCWWRRLICCITAAPDRSGKTGAATDLWLAMATLICWTCEPPDTAAAAGGEKELLNGRQKGEWWTEALEEYDIRLVFKEMHN